MVGRVGAVHVAGWLVASVVLEGSLMCDRERWQLFVHRDCNHDGSKLCNRSHPSAPRR